ncbi:GTPase HflX [compost metagenome]
MYQVALVGYTNAGKSTLLRQLTAADVLVENQLFATLDPTSRTLELPNGKEVVITDTVGFIQNLPHDLVAAFRATLEEANEADLILHVVDSAIDMREEQMKVVLEVLEELGARGKEMITVFNKIDLCPPGQVELLTPGEGDFIRLSAYNQGDLERLKLLIQDKMAGGLHSFRIPAVQGDKISLAYRLGTVVETEVDGEDMVISVDVNAQDYEKFGYLLAGCEVNTGDIDKGEQIEG